MSTEAQIKANQENAKLSTGPNDTSRTSQNAVKHGLTGKTVHLTAAEQEPYRLFHEGHFADFDPKTPNEIFLLESLIDSRWRTAQISKTEAGLYYIGEVDNKTALLDYPAETRADVCRALTFKQNQKEFEKLSRYQARHQREATKALKELKQVQAERKAQELRDFRDCTSLFIEALQGDHPETFQPANFGFVWSQQEVMDHMHCAKLKYEAANKFPATFVNQWDVPSAA